MRPVTIILTIVIGLTVLIAPGPAQQGRYNRLSTAPSAGATSSNEIVERDVSRGSRERSVDAFSGGPYRRSSVEPVEVPRATAAQVGHHYFPSMRVGQGPNRNYIAPHTLCVPGRRAMLPR